MRITTAFISTFALLLLAAPPAIAATPCEDGARVTVDGTVRNLIQSPKGAFMFVETPGWECGRVLVLAKDRGTCQMLSGIHATGTLSQHLARDSYTGWIVSDGPSSNSPGFSSSFTCTDPPPLKK